MFCSIHFKSRIIPSLMVASCLQWNYHQIIPSTHMLLVGLTILSSSFPSHDIDSSLHVTKIDRHIDWWIRSFFSFSALTTMIQWSVKVVDCWVTLLVREYRYEKVVWCVCVCVCICVTWNRCNLSTIVCWVVPSGSWWYSLPLSSWPINTKQTT